MSSNTTIKSTPEAKALRIAESLIKAGNLQWIKGTGYRLPMSRIQAETGLNYSQAYMAIMVPLCPKAEFFPADLSEGQLAGRIQKARLEEGQSWGYIMVRCGGGLTAGRVQALFKQATGYEAAGLRIGRGGRFVNGQGSLYTGADRKDLGCEIPKGQRQAAKPTVSRKLPAVTARQASQGLKPKPTKATVRKAKRQAPKPPVAPTPEPEKAEAEATA